MFLWATEDAVQAVRQDFAAGGDKNPVASVGGEHIFK